MEKVKSVKLKGMENYQIRVTKDYVYAGNEWVNLCLINLVVTPLCTNSVLKKCSTQHT